MSLTEQPLDFPGSEEPVSTWTLRGDGGLSLTVLTFGGIVTRLSLPDAHGAPVDLVLGFRDPVRYAGDHPYFGAIAGRIAGRVTRGELLLDGDLFPLPINDPPNHLHGGPKSIDRQVWQAEPVSRADGAPSLRLHLHSPDGENGYPGSVDLAVTYTVTHDNRFLFETSASSDCPTPVSLTHHSYFNLAGEAHSETKDHRIQVLADHAFETDDSMGLTNRLLPVTSPGNDLRNPKVIDELIPHLHKGHGDLYWLGESSRCRPVARLEDPASGRQLEVATDCPAIQFYTGVSLDGSIVGKSGRPYEPHAGICLECEGYPNAFNDDCRYGSILVTPGKPQSTRTEYRFL